MRRIILLILFPLCLISCASNEWEFNSPDWLQGRWYGKDFLRNDEYIIDSKNSIIRIYFLYYINNKPRKYIQHFYNLLSINASGIEEFNIDHRIYVIQFDVTKYDEGFKIFKYTGNDTIQYFINKVSFSKYKKENLQKYIQEAEFVCELKRLKATDPENKYLEEAEKKEKEKENENETK